MTRTKAIVLIVVISVILWTVTDVALYYSQAAGIWWGVGNFVWPVLMIALIANVYGARDGTFDEERRGKHHHKHHARRY